MFKKWQHRTKIETSDTGFSGTACPYNRWSEVMYGTRERFLPGAFSECLGDASRNIVCTVDHDTSKLLGDRNSGTLTLSDGPDGLRVLCARQDLSYANDLRALIAAGIVNGMSFTFRSIDETYGRDEGYDTRTISKALIREVCFTAFPAYPDTSAELRTATSPADYKSRLKLLEAIACR